VIQKTTFGTEYSQNETLDTLKDTIVLPEQVQAAARGDLQTRTPSPILPTSPLEKRDTFNTRDDPITPMFPSCPPSVQVQRTAEPPPPTSPTLLMTPTTLSHLRPTLTELREGVPIPRTNQRRSLFLPHPNAPKAPPISTSGPMFIVVQQSVPPQASHPSSPSGPPNRSLLDIIHMALHTPAPASLRPRMMSRVRQFMDSSTSI
jgi:hypothetical protein